MKNHLLKKINPEKKPDKSNSIQRPYHNRKQKPSKKAHKPTANLQPRPEPNALDIKSILQQARAEVGIDASPDIDSTNNDATGETSDLDNLDTLDSSNNSSSLDNIPDTLKTYLRTPEERQAEKDAIKADSRLRWLAFYYLSVREHSAKELKQKLLAKDQDPAKIDELLAEFAEKGYQSDHRTALMLIREGIRKGRGRRRIKQDFAPKLTVPSNIDELIDMAVSDGTDFVDVVADEDGLVEGVDWLKLAVEAG